MLTRPLACSAQCVDPSLYVPYYRDQYNRLDVLFYDKNVPTDPGVPIILNQRMNYIEVSNRVCN